jgi:hypothetical protein
VLRRRGMLLLSGLKCLSGLEVVVVVGWVGSQSAAPL